MMTRAAGRVRNAFSLAATLWLSSARADNTLAPEVAAPRLAPPRLLVPLAVPWPAAVRAMKREVTVTLRLTIDVHGKVTHASVVESGGAAFDEAALTALRAATFAPATNDGVAVPARVRFNYRFQPPPQTHSSVRRLRVKHRTAPAPTVRPRTESKAPLVVEVRGVSTARRRKRSAEAVEVVELRAEGRKAADLGEVLARNKAIGVRRSGGLGSPVRFSLNGLTDDQVRFFFDEVPIEYFGFPSGVTNLSVNLVDRVEVYRGVVPVRFGADALGGAVNLIHNDERKGTRGAASYQVGSFGTVRSTLAASHHDEGSGFFARATGFFDTTRNDYEIDVEEPDARGRPSPVRVRRFHDGYRATGASLEGGAVEVPWARKFSIRVFATNYEKELQHNVVMKVPYGDIEYGAFSSGASLRYENLLFGRLLLRLTTGLSYSHLHFSDVGECIYNWYGRCIGQRRPPGELDGQARDQVYKDHAAFGRLTASYKPHPLHKLELTIAPTFFTRTGDERRQTDPTTRDPLTARRDLFGLVSGLEYQLELLERRLENIAFVKAYGQLLFSEEPLPGGAFRERNRGTHEGGFGDALRYRFSDQVYAKASYEYAARLPRPDEVFGNGVLILANLELLPERSHNANLGVTVDELALPFGVVRGDVNGFLRQADDLIVLLGNDRSFTYQNVFGARSLGIELGAGWTSPRQYLALDANLTYFEFRNTSSTGPFREFHGDRIPNRPYLFANFSATGRYPQLFTARDAISLEWHSRFVESFFRGWESAGIREFKDKISSQLTHSLAAIYDLELKASKVSVTLECDNLSDAKAFDFFGVQRPGRAFYFKSQASF